MRVEDRCQKLSLDLLLNPTAGQNILGLFLPEWRALFLELGPSETGSALGGQPPDDAIGH